MSWSCNIVGKYHPDHVAEVPGVWKDVYVPERYPALSDFLQ